MTEPHGGELRYVGKTDDLKRRVWEHFSSARRGTKRTRHVYCWIWSLLKKGPEPDRFVIRECETEQEALETERHFIAYFRFIGCRLTNETEGGEGCRPTATTRRRISEATQKQWATQHERMVASIRKPKSTSGRINMSRAKGGRPIADEGGAVYASASDAAKRLGLDARSVSRAAKTGWTCRGHHFRYAEGT